MSDIFAKILKVKKTLVLLSLTAFLVSCYAPVTSTPSNSGRYNSGTLAKDWRSNVHEHAKEQRYRPTYAYPADNDSDYVYPIKKYPQPQPQPPRYSPPQQKYPNAPYPQDNDDNYYNSYPTYDPDADNSGYYYMNKDRHLPKQKAPNNPTADDNFNYPIYFD